MGNNRKRSSGKRQSDRTGKRDVSSAPCDSGHRGINNLDESDAMRDLEVPHDRARSNGVRVQVTPDCADLPRETGDRNVQRLADERLGRGWTHDAGSGDRSLDRTRYPVLLPLDGEWPRKMVHARSQTLRDTFVPEWFYQRVRRAEIAIVIQWVALAVVVGWLILQQFSFL